MTDAINREIVGVRIKLSSPERIREISKGEVKRITTERFVPKKKGCSASVFSDPQRVMSVPAENTNAAVQNSAE